MPEESSAIGEPRGGGFAVSPFHLQVTAQGKTRSLGRVELEDLARAFAGALFVSLPLLFTEEMWTIALSLSHWMLVGWIVLGYLACAGYVTFAGYRAEGKGSRAWSDAIIALGVGLIASLITLLLIGRYSLDDAIENIFRLGLLEMVPTGIGAAVAMNQLGGGDRSENRPPVDRLQPDVRVLLGSGLGALLFAFNIAPTVETQLITFSVSWWHVLAVTVFSLLVSHLTVFVARTSGKANAGACMSSPWVETLVSYLLALVVGYLLLTMFGYITTSTPWSLQLAWTVLIGYGTTLAGAAGRLIL